MKRHSKRMRWLAVFALWTMCIGWVALQRAYAAGSELMLDAGASMLAYAGATHDAPPQRLLINGAPLFIRSGATADAPSRVIASYAARCRQHPLMIRLPGMLKLGGEDEAFLACLEPDQAIASLAETLERFARALEAGDLAPLGELRFVWAARTAQGARYVAVWTEGGLPWADMFPAAGDAPGSDVQGLPRPRGARRTLSIGRDQGAAALAVYAHGAPLERMLASYATTLRDAGFEVARMPAEDATSAVLHLRKAASSALAFVHEDGARASLVTLVALDAMDASDATAAVHAR
jgi:hypothetical protein